MTCTVSLAKYLFNRLKQQGVREVYGVPGDYTIKAIDHLKQSGLQWISNCNELNAGYTADGSARNTGLSALFTTHSVGELSAINPVAGSYAEHVPVMHVVGSPARRLQESGAVLHHTLGNGRNRVFWEMHEKVTMVCSALSDARTAL
jgi:pyruvate decarboxylase